MSYISDDFPLQLHQLFSQPPRLPAQWITLISNFCRPRLPGAVDYTYFKLLLHHLFSQPPKAPGRRDYTYIKLLLHQTLLTAQGSRAQWITLISSFCRPRLPGAADYTYFKLLLHHLFSAAQGSRAQWITLISSFCSTNSSHSRPRLPGAVDYTYIKLLPPKAPGRSGLHLYQASAPPTLLTAAQGFRSQCITSV
ncbi:hypothetical protein B0H14DRAFT_2658324 [Mycena olivaceomarginata]|nr:hypothetical protein B0H14DRAFT_2658324 [Mycena olivaceomarginata]